MCDTLGMIKNGRAYFAKNSDRSPNEIQVLEYYPPLSGLSGQLDVTYMSLPQAAQTHGVLLSRPAWMWGAEMGINDCGLCIGNEAVFTLGKYGKTGLTGMDMVRLALERCATAIEARDILISLLEEYGQGGNCGFDHDFYYDNAFLVMDRQDIFVLETAGKEWVWKSFDKASISNRLSIRTEGDAYSGGKPYDFFKKHREPIYTTFSGSAKRRSQTQCSLRTAETTGDFISALKTHDEGAANPFARGSVSSACMHYGGMVGDHTTASIVVDLDSPAPSGSVRTLIWATGTSCPCVSLFKPWIFGSTLSAPVFTPDIQEARDYWLKAEDFRRKLLGKALPPQFYTELNDIQSCWLQEAENTCDENFPAFAARCLTQETEFYDKWSAIDLPPAPEVSRAFLKRWEKKNAVLEKK